jgi:hypothetical protein
MDVTLGAMTHKPMRNLFQCSFIFNIPCLWVVYSITWQKPGWCMMSPRVHWCINVLLVCFQGFPVGLIWIIKDSIHLFRWCRQLKSIHVTVTCYCLPCPWVSHEHCFSALFIPYPRILFLLSPSPVARRPVVLLAFLLNRSAQKADIRPVYAH